MQREAADSKEIKLDGRIPTIAQIPGATPACCISIIPQGFVVCLRHGHVRFEESHTRCSFRLPGTWNGIELAPWFSFLLTRRFMHSSFSSVPDLWPLLDTVSFLRFVLQIPGDHMLEHFLPLELVSMTELYIQWIC